MEVIEIKPHGYCSGVYSALALAKRAKDENPDRRVFLLGLMVHNEDAVRELSDYGLLLLDERKGPLLGQLKTLKEGDVVVFSAHGHPHVYDILAAEKGLKVYDATCPFVKGNESEGKKANEVVYFGVKGHLESEGFLANNPHACFYDVASGFVGRKPPQGSSPLLIAQTTLGPEELEKGYLEVESEYPNSKRGKARCQATISRQKAILENYQKTDATIILGSTLSNNSRKLYELASRDGKPAFLILNLEGLEKLDLSIFKKVALASGASTSPRVYEECLAYLKEL